MAERQMPHAPFAKLGEYDGCSDEESLRAIHDELIKLNGEQYEYFKLDRYEWGQFETPYAVLPLSQGYFAIIDRRDLRKVQRFKKWFADIQRHPDTGEILKIYATANALRGKKRYKVYLHRLVAGLVKVAFAKKRAGAPLVEGSSVRVDHVNGLTLDCRRRNLKLRENNSNVYRKVPRSVHPELLRGVEYRNRAHTLYGGVVSCKREKTRSSRTWKTQQPAYEWAERKHKQLHGHPTRLKEAVLSWPVFPPLRAEFAEMKEEKGQHHAEIPF